MSRRIKFRALKDDVSNCEMVYGNLIYGVDEITKEKVPKIQHGNEINFHTSLKGTEGQFTGVLDKNGTEIYEGDIVEWKQASKGILPPIQETYVCLIEWNSAVKRWKCRLLNKPDHCGFTFSTGHIQVIGNIHQNPELLKEFEAL